MFFQCINIRQVLWEVLKTEAFGLGFQHLPRDLANINAWKTLFDPYSEDTQSLSTALSRHQKKWGTNNDKTKATYEITDTQRKTATEVPPCNGR